MSVTVRAAASADASSIAAIYAPQVTHGFASFEAQPPSAAEFARRMTARPLLPWLVAVEPGRVIGFAYASVHRGRAAYRWSVDCSVYVDPNAVGGGVGRALYGRLLPELVRLGYVSAFAGIALPNPASVALHEAVGFTAVGVYHHVGFKRGAWRDVGWWEVSLREPPVRPDEPAEWSPAEFRGDG